MVGEEVAILPQQTRHILKSARGQRERERERREDGQSPIRSSCGRSGRARRMDDDCAAARAGCLGGCRSGRSECRVDDASGADPSSSPDTRAYVEENGRK